MGKGASCMLMGQQVLPLHAMVYSYVAMRVGSSALYVLEATCWRQARLQIGVFSVSPQLGGSGRIQLCGDECSCISQQLTVNL
jgi:hypothetical protein